MKKHFALAALALAISFGSVSCKKKTSDAELQSQATTVVTSNPNASVEVKDGSAHLSGIFQSEAERDNMIASLKAIPGIKDVHEMTTIAAPEVVETTTAADPEIQQKVNDALKDFPSAKAEVINGELTITGDVSASQARQIKESVDALQVGKVNYNYNVK